jgi:hypothetical protein
MLEDFIALIKDVGFPIAVASFVLFRMNGKLDRLTNAIDRLIDRMERHQEGK